MIEWIIKNWIEIVAVATGLGYIFFSIRQHIACWPLGIISSFMYVYVFFAAKIYADLGLQLYYVVMGVYGWIHWSGADEHRKAKDVRVQKTTARQALYLLVVTVGLFWVLVWFLKTFTDSPVPYVDSFTTALSFTATWMLARKMIEHWWIWVVVNTVSIGLYFYRGLYPSIVLFAVLAIMAVVGYYQWKKELSLSNQLLENKHV